jgi:hypothetical protein
VGFQTPTIPDTHELVGRSNRLAHPLSEPRGGRLFGDRKRIEAVADWLTALREEIEADT